MHAKRQDSKIFLAVFVTLLCLHAVLVLTMRLYPFIDMPNHLAAATICRHHGDASNLFSTYYSVDLFLKPNVFHLLFCAMPMLGPVELANTLFLGLYTILLPLSVLLLMRKLGGNRWFSLLSFLLLYNYNVLWGFVGFAFAIPLVLFFFTAGISFIEKGRWKTGAIAAVLLVLLFFVHALAALFSLVLYIAYCVLTRKPPVVILERCAAIAPAAVLVIIWWNMEGAAYRGQGLGEYLDSYYSQVFLATYADRLGIFHQDNSHLFVRGKGTAAGLLFSLCVIVPVMVAAMQRRAQKRPKHIKGLRPALILFITSLACVLVLPQDLPNQAVLYQRFSVILLLSLILLGGCLFQASLRRTLLIGICAVCAVDFALWADYFRDFNKRNSTFTPELLPAAGRGVK